MRQRLRDDDGISLVEVMVGMSIIMIALAAFASTLSQSLLVVTSDEQLVRANQLAAEQIEAARSAEFDCQGDPSCIHASGELGFYEDDPGWTAAAPSDGEPMVSLGATRPFDGSDPAPGPLPQEAIQRDGITYDVRREIVWVDDAATAGTEDYKEVRVGLQWTVRGTPYSTGTSSVRYDTPDPIASCTPGTIVDFDISPDFVLISSSGNNLDAIVVTVETCTRASVVKLTPDPLSQMNMVEVPGSGGTRWEVRNINDGNVQFLPQTYEWRVEMTSVDGGDSRTRDVVFHQESTAILTLQTIAVTPTTFCLRRSGSDHFLSAPAQVAVHLTGARSGDQVTVRWTGNPDGVYTTSVGSVDSSSNAHLAVTIPADSPFLYKTSGRNRVTTSTITVSAVRGGDQAPVSRSAIVDLRPVGTAPC